MALIKCAECGKEISDQATACPGCGRPIPKKTSSQKASKGGLGCGFWIVIFLVVGFIANECENKGPIKQNNATSTSASNHSSSFIKESDFEKFRTIIASHGYVCRTCEGGHFLGEEAEGKVFRVYCNDNSIRYKVIITPSGAPIVSPW